jgi:hypothetical protein
MAQYTKGQQVRLSLEVYNSTPALANATVALSIKAPDGTVTTPTPTNDSTGKYHSDLTLSSVGTWWYRWATTGTVVQAVEGDIGVNASQF